MKNKYLIGAAVLSLAILGGGAALAQTPPGTSNDNAGVPSALVGNGQNSGLAPQNNVMPRNGLTGRYGANIGGRRTMSVGTPFVNTMLNRFAYENIGLTAWHIFAGMVTILLVWTLLILAIISLLKHLKTTCRCKCKAEKDEMKK
jgi:hypothetical protein